MYGCILKAQPIGWVGWMVGCGALVFSVPNKMFSSEISPVNCNELLQMSQNGNKWANAEGILWLTQNACWMLYIFVWIWHLLTPRGHFLFWSGQIFILTKQFNINLLDNKPLKFQLWIYPRIYRKHQIKSNSWREKNCAHWIQPDSQCCYPYLLFVCWNEKYLAVLLSDIFPRRLKWMGETEENVNLLGHKWDRFLASRIVINFRAEYCNATEWLELPPMNNGSPLFSFVFSGSAFPCSMLWRRWTVFALLQRALAKYSFITSFRSLLNESYTFRFYRQHPLSLSLTSMPTSAFADWGAPFRFIQTPLNVK